MGLPDLVILVPVLHRPKNIDPLMERTRTRPLPSKRVTPTEALVFGILQCVAAEAYLYFFVNGLTAFLGILVIVGYVLVYTPLKTKTTACTAIGCAVPIVPATGGAGATKGGGADTTTAGAPSSLAPCSPSPPALAGARASGPRA